MNKIKTILKNIATAILPQRIWTRALLILLLTMFISEGISLYVFHDRHWRFVNYKLNDSLASEVTFLYREIERNNNYINYYNEQRNNIFDINIIIGIENDFTQLEPLLENKQRIRLERSLKNYLQEPFRLAYYDDEVGEDNVAIGVASNINDGRYYYFIVPKGRVFDNSIQLFLDWLLISSVLLSTMAGYFLYRQVRPLVTLSAMADNFGKGRYWIDEEDGDGDRKEDGKDDGKGDGKDNGNGKRLGDEQGGIKEIPIKGASEIRMVARSFNQMMKRISYQIKQRTIMLAGVSHDLRTPITKLRLNLAFIEGDENKKNKEVIEKMKSNLDEMEKMITLYLQFAKGEDEEAMQSVAVKKFIEGIVSEWQSEMKKNKKMINAKININGDIAILMRAQAIRRCLNNIIANSFKHAKQVKINVNKIVDGKTREAFVVIDIADNGKGIAIEERQKIFDAFYQVKGDAITARKEKKDDEDLGFGLGLAISRDIVLGHGGNITVGDGPDGGAIFSISLPI